jgi:uncharacterized DUF497 family protein
MYKMHMDVRCDTLLDPSKNAANLLKHGVSLAEADGVLNDPLGITVEDEAVEGEARWVTIGTSSFGSPRVVVWTQRAAEARIISVRRPAPRERRAYEEGV